MFQLAEYDTALIATGDTAAQAAHAAAATGASLMILGSEADGHTLVDTVEVALRAHVPFVVLRPRLQQAALAFLVELAAADTGWRPHFLDLAITGTDEAMRVARDAVAIAQRLMHGTAASVGAGAIGEPSMRSVVTGEIRYADARIASLRARTGTEEQVRLVADCPFGELELRSDAGESTLTMRFRDGRRDQSHLLDRDLFAQEALRAARVIQQSSADGHADDALFAPRDGSALIALEQSIETGQIVAVEERSTRANLVLMEGHGLPTETRRGHLHLVGV